jgi:pimeloyl-ACP methyl ester carboxylesterase
VPEDVMQAHYELARRRTAFPWAMPSYLEAARSVVRTLARRRRYEAMMRAITAPTLLIQGAQDRLVPLAAARAAARAHPSWRFEVYDDIGHTPQLEAPDRLVDSVLRFCAGAAEDAA